MDMLMNPVVLSVLVMIILCLLKLNIILALLISAVVAGVSAGMPLAGDGSVMQVLIDNMGGQSETALSYVLLGCLAMALSQTGITSVLCDKLKKIVKGRRFFLLLLLAVCSCLSQNLIPIHIAFIPILIPPMLSLFNELKIDRRAVACALTFGLKAPYIAIPAGFGLIFHGILSTEMAKSGIHIAKTDVWHYTWMLGLSMVFGLLIAIFISYSRKREYEDRPLQGLEDVGNRTEFSPKDLITLVALVIAVYVQLHYDSMPLGVLAALVLMFLFGALRWGNIEKAMTGGLGIMGMIAIIMLVASGYGGVIRATNAVDHLVNGVVAMVGGSQFYGALLMLLVGLLVTMGIGTSFGTIPVVAAIYCPLGLKLGFSPASVCCLLAAAAALGDAGSPASDSTLGPTSGLNFDGQHDHIWDTCVPTFLHYNLTLIVGGMVCALMIFH
ncbi:MULTISPECIES: Na+/H+ antiporter family protein [Jonquetella]|uniref:Putative permease n=1 Tax=Jonquetella anthropi DSM 22815 TaxID=885272 RepID=H0UKE9_9BACT|nr:MULTISPECIES: Na+/H+ antiporter NhaC family protein [Jonquetella]EEX48545.1 Na+/H+ antiporter family protein [Jonquetella anthropi E3_33 E1]EHM13158.1 putative permease [Jonquetella anthropi DSM 22815]ERL24755.1 Na+/H+ antiporter family protein [Jonquetella sp. BV3C21]